MAVPIPEHTFSIVTMISIRIWDSALFRDRMRICTVSSYDRPIMRPNFSYMLPKQLMAALKRKMIRIRKVNVVLILNTHSFVGRKLGESSLFLRISLHLFTVSKSRKVSPTEKRVAKQAAISFRVGGPGEP